MTLNKNSKGLCYTLGEAIKHLKRGGVIRHGSRAGNTYRT